MTAHSAVTMTLHKNQPPLVVLLWVSSGSLTKEEKQQHHRARSQHTLRCNGVTSATSGLAGLQGNALNEWVAVGQSPAVLNREWWSHQFQRASTVHKHGSTLVCVCIVGASQLVRVALVQ